MNDDERFTLPSEEDAGVGRDGSFLGGLLQQGARAVSPTNLSLYYRDKIAPSVDAGLGLGRRGVEAVGSGLSSGLDAITPSRDTLYRVFQGLEAAGAVGAGRTPLYLQQQHLDLQRQQIQGQAEERKQAMAMRIQQQEEAQRAHAWDENFKVLTNDKLTAAQQMGIFRERGKTDPIAEQFAHGINEKMIGRFNSLQPYMPHPPEYYIEGLKKGTINFDHVTQDMDVGEETRTLVTKSMAPTAVATNLERLAKENPDNPHYARTLQEYRAKQQEVIDKAAITHASRPALEQQPQATLEKTRGENELQGLKIIPNVPLDDKGTMGLMLYNERTGEKKILQSGMPITRQETIPATMLKDRSEVSGAIKSLQDVAHLFHPDFVGTYDSVKNKLARIMGTSTERTRTDRKTGQEWTVKEEDFHVAYDLLQKELRKFLMGTAQSVQEITTNPLAFPSVTDSDADVVIPAFLRTHYKNLVNKLSAQDEVLDQRRRQSPLPMAQRYQQLLQNATATDAKGDNALGFKTPDEINQAVAERLAEEVQRGWVTK